MCGICGIVRTDGAPVDRRALERQVHLLRHRGPDGCGIWAEAGVGIGHTRLSIVDLSDAGAQPMATPDGRFVITYNGELYNAAEIRRALTRRWTFRGHSDTEVLLYAFAEGGAAAFERLEGMFALAIHDRATGETWLARDPFGIKPLYYHRDARRVVFASEIRALLAAGDVPRAPNLNALRQHVLFGFALDPETAFADIYRVPPGHWARVRADGSFELHEYWNVRALLDVPVGGLLETLDDSVARHAIADVPVGIFLSAGIDSSMLMARSLVARDGVRSLTPFNVGLREDDPVDAPEAKMERSVAERTCGALGIDLVRVDAIDGAVSIEEMTRSIEEPICNPSNAMIDLVCGVARDGGTKVLLSGHGGDELFAGYRRHVWARWFPWLRASGAGFALRAAARATGHTVIRRMADSIGGAEHPLLSAAALGWDLVTEHRVADDWLSSREIPAASAGMLRMLEGWRDLPLLKQMMLLDIRTYLAAQNLINMDKASMRRSVEVRVPFLYRPLAAIGLQAPPGRLVEGRRNKAMLRRVARDVLPSFLLEVPKHGFGPPQVPLVQAEEGRELLLGARARQRGMFRPDVVARLHASLTPRSEHAAVQLYTLAIMEQWFQSFIDRDPLEVAQ